MNTRENNGTLLEQTIREPGTSREFTDNPQTISIVQELSNKEEINSLQSPSTQNISGTFNTIRQIS